jgi:phosphatidylserine decarboxylase
MSSAFAKLQNVLPQHALSRAIGRLATTSVPWIKGPFIRNFARAYGVDMSEAERSHLDDYATFNDFFTRALKPDARPMDDDPLGLVCPADGTVSQLGTMDGETLLQAKGHRYSLHQLAGPLASGLQSGTFCTIYLAPRDYHRVHLPYAARLSRTLAIPGALFSVNGTTERAIPGLFCRNERLVCRFDTPFGPMLVVLVGAMIVASIDTVFAGPRSPYRSETATEYALDLERGAEVGRFLLGSTVICCFPKGTVNLDPNLVSGSTVRMGSPLGRVRTG